MKIGILCLTYMVNAGPSAVAAQAYTAFNKYTDCSVCVDYLYINGSGKPPKNLPRSDVPVIYLNWRKPEVIKNVLGSYDLVYLASPGYGTKMDVSSDINELILSSIKKASVMIGGERDVILFKKFYDYLKSDKVKVIHFYTKDFYDHYVKNILGDVSLEGKIIEYGSFFDPTEYCVSDTCIKVNRIVSTSRIVACKRIYDLMIQSEDLMSNGYSVDIYGAMAIPQDTPRYREMDKMKVLRGTFLPDHLSNILSTAKFHYNYFYRVNKTLARRFDNTTLEAMAYGCVPILNRYHAPQDYVDLDIAIFPEVDKEKNEVCNIREAIDSKLKTVSYESLSKSNLDYVRSKFNCISTLRRYIYYAGTL